MGTLKPIEGADGIHKNRRPMLDRDGNDKPVVIVNVTSAKTDTVFEVGCLRVERWMQRGKFKGYSLTHIPTDGRIAIFEKRKAAVIACAKELASLSSWAAFDSQGIKWAEMNALQQVSAVEIWRVLLKHGKAMKPSYQFAVRDTLNKALEGKLDGTDV